MNKFVKNLYQNPKAIFLDLNEQVCQKLISESKSYLFGLE